MNRELIGTIFKDPTFDKIMIKVIEDLQFDRKNRQELNDLDKLVHTEEFKNAVSAKIHGQICWAILRKNVSGKEQG